ncbi:MAG: hypothetical protein IIT68_06495 [Treponema sp.]|nr:hypothetical protein [Treponema sp.]
MKKLTSIVLAAVTAVLLACAFSACGNPNGSSGGGNSGSNNATILPGTYSGQLEDVGGTTNYSITVYSDGTAFMPYTYGDIEGPITTNGNNFTITGTRNGTTPITLTGTISADGTTLSNIKIDGSAKSGTLIRQ